MIPCRAGNDRCPRPLAYLFKIIFPQQLMASKYFYVKKKNKAHRCLLPAPGNPQAGVLCWAVHKSSLPHLALLISQLINIKAHLLAILRDHCFRFAFASDQTSKHPKGHSVPPVTHGPSVRNAFAQDVTKSV